MPMEKSSLQYSTKQGKVEARGREGRGHMGIQSGERTDMDRKE